MKYISDDMRWFEATPIVNEAIIDYTNKRFNDCIKIVDYKERIKISKQISEENNKIKLAFNRMLIG